MDEIKKYINNSLWEVKENANAGYSFSGLQLMLAENAIKEHMLENHYKGKISKAYNDGFIHIHDLGMGNVCYCMGHDLKEVLEQGFNGVIGKIQTTPSKHMRTAIGHMINYLFTHQAENAGAQAFNNIDTLLAPYVRVDNLSYKDVKQNMQEFIYNMNVANRVGFQAVFSNVTFDLKCPEQFKNQKPKINNIEQSFTYGDLNKEIGMIAQAFFEVMMEGDGVGQPFTFPIPTVNLHKDFVWDDEVAMTIFKATAKYGTANFQNFLNSDLDPADTYSMCCRLRLDKKELIKNSGGLFGSGNKTGSIGVVTINLPMISYEVNSRTEEPINIESRNKLFFKELEKYMNIAKESLEIKRKIINENLDHGLMPYSKRYIGTYKNHFSTIAILGANEMCMNLINEDITTKNGREFTKNVLAFMKNKISEYQEETGNYYNLEQAPAEGAAYKLAIKAKNKFNDIITAGSESKPYFTNSTHLPVNHNMSLFKMLKTQDEFNAYYNGGTIVHVFLGQKVTDWINCMLMVKRIANNTRIPFFDLSPTFSICPIHGYISGEHKYCPLDHSEEDLKKYGIITEEE